jgi:hypothetical protein
MHNLFLTPIVGAAPPRLSSRAVVFSAGGDGGGKLPEFPAESTRIVCGSQRCRNNRDLWVHSSSIFFAALEL